jgi:hypothetical protein
MEEVLMLSEMKKATLMMWNKWRKKLVVWVWMNVMMLEMWSLQFLMSLDRMIVDEQLV